jgi:hypothetical protein
VDYLQGHVVTLEECLRVMQQKTMDKEAIKKSNERKTRKTN